MIRCIAIDDEPIALSIITQYCNRRGEIELSTYTNPIEGMEVVRRELPDLLFLDIEMGGVNGVELARELPMGVSLIFTTAYAQFAIDGFDLNAVDYLHKPFAFSRFERAVERVEQKIELMKSSAADDDEITLKVEYQSVRVSRSKIEYIEAMDNYVKIYLNSARPILSQMSMKSVEELLPAEQFMRVHKSYIIARQGVAAYSKREIQMRRSGVVVPIGRTYQGDFVKWISE
ncbi:MAG: LytTR family DNA-binding domain-containing protein [Rikenellaceae bacterium]